MDASSVVDNHQGYHDAYASDRDVFLFLVDDTHPIEAGRWRTDRRFVFPGLLLLELEVGSKTSHRPFYLRAVCMNRNLWGVENFEEITPAFKLPDSVLLTRRHRRSRVSLILAAAVHRRSGGAGADRRP